MNRTLLLIALLAVCGCGDASSGRVGVSGRVTFDGAPIEQGSIAFLPADGKSGPAAGATIENGYYTVPAAQGPAAGLHRVEIKAQRKTGRQFRDDFRPPPDNLVDEVEQFLPARYHQQSELTVTLSAGANEQTDFDLSP